MPTDVGSLIMVSTLLLALFVLVCGWLLQRRGVVRGTEADVLADVVVPPSLPAGGSRRWWRVPSALYNRYDLLMAGFVGGLYLLPVVQELVSGKAETPEMTMSLAVGTVAIQFFMVALVTGFVAWRIRPAAWLGLRWREWPLGFPIAIVGVLFTWGVVALLQMVGYLDWLQDGLDGDGKQEVVKAFTETGDPVLLGMLVFLAVVVAPLTEEVLFRGYLYPVAKRFVGSWAGVIFSALVFAAVHNNAQAVIPLFVLAVLLTLSYELTGSIWAPVGMHMAFNGATVAAQLAARFGWIELPAT